MDSKILLACMPKSGSTFLKEALANLPGMTKANLVPRYGRREQEMCRKKLDYYDSLGNGYVSQLHVRYSQFTAECIEKHHLVPIVLVRNIFDVIPSLIDHHSKENTVYPFAYAPQEIVDWSFEDAARFVTTMVIPWYFNFYVSWHDCTDNCMVVYDEWVGAPAETLKKIVERTGETVTSKEIDAALEKSIGASKRKNTVVSGRGNSLPQDCQDQIYAMAAFYKGIDFSPIGIQ